MPKRKQHEDIKPARDPFFTPMDLREDPLRGVAGLAWYQRKPSSLTPEEWAALDKALADGRINSSEYADWKLNVR
jgi:hypothetical protein